MRTFSLFHLVRASIICLTLFTAFQSDGQTTYLRQSFDKTSGLINPLPDSTQFSHVILTAPALSYHKFHKGYIELTRTQQDSATGGIIRVMRATPFLPSPKTLLIQITLSAESIQSKAVNAIYFYVGEDFNPVNNSFPGNGLMFGRCAINFTGNSFIIKDPETQVASKPIDVKKMVTLSWVLNNSSEDLKYQLSAHGDKETVSPGNYDLWVDVEAIHKGTEAYPGNSPFSPTKLSNFEIRYRNGLGQIRIHDILIREGNSVKEPEENVIMPNPVSGHSFIINAKNMNLATLNITRLNGQELPFEKEVLSAGRTEIRLGRSLNAGMYVLHFLDLDKKDRFIRFVVE
ncbi:T9SS type A sorting domain-containing protein [Dyadobacter arcticus]|uniref:T9SS type A sorting domain-containing protein n=1 Tax=Dyadobacter arcticus TaxID=1078754 RepID=A0ABX0UIY5_9BACT|nr:T9SS type A sorting domain-containing protein [Dyadobacter arcticus]NIJ51655.1 hypothetical protein [Dyadobacter arcticus]